MVQIYGSSSTGPKPKLLEVIATARERYAAKPSLLDGALRALETKAINLSPDVVSAIRSMELKYWIYLKDTRSHSILIDLSATVAYGVLGLTERLRSIVGDSGAIVETALMRYHGSYICDGIISNVAWLGPNYRRDFTKELATLRAQGKFHKTYAL